jgi:hypothetical protein
MYKIMKIDTTTISKITSQSDMDDFVEGLGLQGKKVVIKPNWVSAMGGGYSEAKILDMFLKSLGQPAIFVESHTFWRTDKMAKGEGDYFSSSEADLETGKMHWDFFKEQDELFLKTTGIKEVLDKHGAQYINITNEIWSGAVADPAQIKKLVEAKYPPAKNSRIYSLVPKKVYDLKGLDFISFSKAKLDSSYGASLSIKNLFGLIPDPTRWVNWHGGDPEQELLQSILDIHKIYQSLFKMTFIAEGVFMCSYMDWGKVKNHPIENWGAILGGNDGYQVDSVGLTLVKRKFAGPLSNLLGSYQGVFGGKKISKTLPHDLVLQYNITD